jgi:hypothetical protein
MTWSSGPRVPAKSDGIVVLARRHDEAVDAVAAIQQFAQAAAPPRPALLRPWDQDPVRLVGQAMRPFTRSPGTGLQVALGERGPASPGAREPTPSAWPPAT